MNSYGLGLILNFVDNASSGMRNATNVFNQMSGTADSLGKSVGSAHSSIAQLATTGTVLTAVGDAAAGVGTSIMKAYMGIGQTVIETGGMFIGYERQLTALYKDADKAVEIVERMKEYAEQSVFEIDDLISSVTMMKVVGIEALDAVTSSSGETSQTLLDYASDIAAMMPNLRNIYGTGSAAAMGALKEYIAEGNAMTLKRSAGLDITGLLGEKKGETIEERSRQVADLVELLGIAGYTAKLFGTPGQILSNLADYWKNFMGVVAKEGGVYDNYARIITKLGDFVTSLVEDTDRYNALVEIVSNVVNNFLDLADRLLDKVLAIADAFTKWAAENPELASTILKVGMVLGGVLVVFGLISKYAGSFFLLRASMMALRGSTVGILSAVGSSFFTTLLPMIGLALIFKTAWDKNLGGFQDKVKKVAKTVSLTFKALFIGVSDDSGRFADLSVEDFELAKEMGILPFIEGMLDLKTRVSEFFTGFKEGFDNAITKVSEFFGKIFGSGDGKFASFGERLKKMFGFESEFDFTGFGKKIGGLSVSLIALISGVKIGTKIWGLLSSFFGLGGKKGILGGLSSGSSFAGNSKAMTNLLTLIGVAGVIYVLGITLNKLKDVETEKILPFLAGFSLILFGLSSVISASAQVKTGAGVFASFFSLIALAGVMWVLGETLIKLGKSEIDSDKIYAYCIGLATSLIGFGIFMKAAGSIPLAGVGKALLSLVGIVGVIIGVAALISWASTNPDIVAFFNGGAAFLGKLVGTFQGAMEAAKINQLNTSLAEMGDTEIDTEKVTEVKNAAQIIADFSEGLPKKDVITKIVDSIFGSDLSQFATGVTDFGTAMQSFATSLSGITFDGDLSPNTTKAIAIAKEIQAFQEGLPKKTPLQKVVDWVTGSELSQFATGMADFGSGFNSFATSLSKVTFGEELSTNVTQAIAIAKQLQAFQEGLPPKTSIQKVVDWVTGSELSQFSTGMSDFGAGFNSFATSLSKVTFGEDLSTNVTQAISIAKQILAFQTGLPPKTSIQKVVDWIAGSELSQFTSGMVDFGSGFNSFADSMSKVTFEGEGLSESTTKAIGIAKEILAFQTGLPPKTEFQKVVDWVTGSELSQFSTGMADFGAGFNAFATQMGLITVDTELTDKSKTAVDIAKSINELNTALPPTDVIASIFGADTPLKSFSGDIVAFASSFNSFNTEMQKVNSTEGLEGKTKDAVAIVSVLKTFSEDLPDSSFLDRLFGATKMKSFSGDVWAFAESFNSFATEMGKITVDSELESKTTVATGILDQIKTLIASLEGVNLDEKTGALSWLGVGETKSKSLFTIVEQFAEAINKVGTQLSTLGDTTAYATQFTEAYSSVEKIFNFIKDNQGERIDASNFNTTIWAISDIGWQIQQLNTNLTGVDITSINTLLTAVGTISTGFANLSALPEGSGDVLSGIPSKLTEIITSISTEVSGLESSIGTDMDSIISHIGKLSTDTKTPTDDLNTALAGVNTKTTSMASTMTSTMSTLATSVISSLNSITNAFNGLTWKLPNIKIPTVSVSYSKDDKGLDIPKFAINWNAKGGIFDSPTIFNTNRGYQGVGEAGAEAILPLSDLWNEMTTRMRTVFAEASTPVLIADNADLARSAQPSQTTNVNEGSKTEVHFAPGSFVVQLANGTQEELKKAAMELMKIIERQTEIKNLATRGRKA